MKSRIVLLTLLTCVILQLGCKKDSPANIENPPKKDETTTLPPADTKPDVVLDRPINLTVSKGTFGNKVTISWTPVPLAKKYQVYRFSDSEQQYKLLVETADTTVTDVVTTPLVKVFYKVKIYNSTTEYSLFSDINYGYTSGKNYIKRLSFGSEGLGVGQFQYPMHVETDSDNNIYVSDENNYKVEKYSKDGSFLELFASGPGPRAIAFLNNGNAVTTYTASALKYVRVTDKQKKVVAEWAVTELVTVNSATLRKLQLMMNRIYI
jgi:hypothetical protein